MKNIFLSTALSVLTTIVFAQSQPFSVIKVESASKVYIKQDSAWSLQNEGQGFTTGLNVKDDVLTLEGDPRSTFHVSTPSVKKIIVSGIGNITGENTVTGDMVKIEINGSGSVNLKLDVKKIDAEVSGVGKITLAGFAEEAKFTIPGSGKVDASELKVKRCNAAISGMGKCIIDVTDELNADISGTGSVLYKTMPKVLNQNVSGLGKIKAVDTAAVAIGDTTKLNFENWEMWIIGKKKHKEEKARPFWAGFDLGINSYLSNDNKLDLPSGLKNYDLRMEKSISVSLNFWQESIEIAKSNIWFVTGLGVTWNNYRFDPDIRLSSGSYTTATKDTNSSVRHIKSKLTASYLTAPFMIQVLTSRNPKKAFHIGAGAILGLRIGTHSKVKYEIDGDTKKDKDDESFNLNPFRYGFRVNIGYGKLNVFADYYASTLFKENRGPVLYPVNAGVTLIGF